jgi:hypothetical protein
LWGAVGDDQIKQVLRGSSIEENVTRLLDLAEAGSAEKGDNMSAIGLQWGDKLHSDDAVSTVTLPLGFSTTIMNPHTRSDFDGVADPSQADDLSDEDIERTIAEIQIALQKTKRT